MLEPVDLPEPVDDPVPTNGHLVLEFLLRHLQDRTWWKVGQAYLLVANTYDHEQSRLEIEYTFVSDGRTEVRYGSHRAYSYAELRDLLTSSGFDVRIDGDPWTRDTQMITVVGTRR